MWNEGVCIYDTLGVHNNFPLFDMLNLFDTLNLFFLSIIMLVIHTLMGLPFTQLRPTTCRLKMKKKKKKSQPETQG